jgi:hypothetical protein
MMLREFFSIALAAGLIAEAHAADLAKADPAPALTTASTSSQGESKSFQDFYLLCAFYPKPGICEDVYRHAMTDKDIKAQAVRAEYEGYARYLGNGQSLTDADRQYLRENQIRFPNDLSPADQGGLHNVINDPTLAKDADARRGAVNNFLSRAVEAQLYCGLGGSCNIGGGGSAMTSGAAR